MKSKLLKIAAGVLAFFIAGTSAFAVNVSQIPKEEVDSVYAQSVQSNSWKNWPKGPNIYSEAGIVMNADTGAILYAKNIDAPHYPASITKVLTALVALENSKLTDVVTVKYEDISFLKKGDNHIGLRVNEQITMEDALHGTLLASGNEVAHAVASNATGDYEQFIKLMNTTAKALGCKNSNFTNSHGLHDDNHYTTARDMALISSAAFQNADFRRITKTKQYTIPETNVTNETRTFQHHHKMLFDWRKQYYPYCVGGKTGYTDKALNTLVTFASKDGVNLVAVILRNHGGKTYDDTKAMLDYGFENFTSVPVTTEMVTKEMEDGSLIKAVKKDSYLTLPANVSYERLKVEVKEPTDLGDKTAEFIYTYDGHEMGTIKATITDEAYNEMHGIESGSSGESSKKHKTKSKAVSTILKVILIVVLVVVIGFAILLIYLTIQRRKKRRRRRRRGKQSRQAKEFDRYIRKSRRNP